MAHRRDKPHHPFGSGDRQTAGARPSPARRAFGGRLGNAVLILGLPVFTAYLFFAVRFNEGAVFPTPRADLDAFVAALSPRPSDVGLYAGWLALQAALQQFGPGRRVLGSPLPNGQRLPYRMNGWFALATTAAVIVGLHLTAIVPLRTIHDRFGGLLTVSTGAAFLLGGFLYAYGRRYDGRSALRSGSFIHDFWMGTSHNPRLPWSSDGFDLKLFCEARPGLLLWIAINSSFAFVQFETYGFVSIPMALVWVFQLVYVADYFANEPAILTTMDIKHERFGFMLAFGDLVWVPMTYSLQAHYLVHNAHSLPLWAAVAVVALNVTGYAVFRTVNLQKHRFREDPDRCRIWNRKAEYIQTDNGGPLLVSGFWGWSRHFNYVGDILMAVSWSLPCGFASALPYFYPAYFAALLVHRERRDHAICAAKYGAAWQAYCRRVPYRIVPGLY